MAMGGHPPPATDTDPVSRPTRRPTTLPNAAASGRCSLRAWNCSIALDRQVVRYAPARLPHQSVSPTNSAVSYEHIFCGAHGLEAGVTQQMAVSRPVSGGVAGRDPSEAEARGGGKLFRTLGRRSLGWTGRKVAVSGIPCQCSVALMTLPSPDSIVLRPPGTPPISPDVPSMKPGETF